MKDLGDGLDQQGLGQSRGTRDEAMASGKQANQKLFRDFLLPNDHLG